MVDRSNGDGARGGPIGDDNSGVGTTVVGGQPPGRQRRPLAGVPLGIERVLLAAAADPALRVALCGPARATALQGRAFALTASETAMLMALPGPQLEAAIARLDTSHQNLERRRFMKAVAASVITLAAAGAQERCGGIRPDDVIEDTPSAPGGVRPDDVFEDVPKVADGARVDVPEWGGPDLYPETEPANLGIRPDAVDGWSDGAPSRRVRDTAGGDDSAGASEILPDSPTASLGIRPDAVDDSAAADGAVEFLPETSAASRGNRPDVD